MRMRLTRVAMLMVIVVSVAGCVSTQPLDANLMAQRYYGQQTNRVYSVFEVSNVNEISFKGSNMHFAVRSVLDPLSIIPRDPGVATTLIGTAGRVAVAGLGIYTAGNVMNKLADQPKVVPQQVVEPTVVNPVVVQP